MASAADCKSPPAAIAADPSASTTASSVSDSDESPWSSLPADLLDLIGWRVLAAGDLLDYVRLRAACAHWRASTASPRGRGIIDPRFHPRRWKIMPPDYASSTTRRFMNTSTGAFARQRLPLLGSHVVLGSVDGILLLLLKKQQQQGYSVSNSGPRSVLLLHPFTGDSLDLPPISPTTTPPEVSPSSISNLQALPSFPAALSVSAAGVATVKIATYVFGKERVLFASSGEGQQWRVSAWNLKPFPMPVSFQGKLYALGPPKTMGKRKDGSSSSTRPIVELDPLLPAPKLIAVCPAAAEFSGSGLHYGLSLGVQDWGEPELRVFGYGRNGVQVFIVADLVAGKIAPSVNIPLNMRRRKYDSLS